MTLFAAFATIKIVMLRFILRLLSNSIALWVAYLIVPGFVVGGGIKSFLIAGVLLGALNLTVKPILKFISTPVIILTLGIFSLVINGFVLWLVSFFLDFVTIETLSALVWSTVIVSIVNVVVTAASKAFASG